MKCLPITAACLPDAATLSQTTILSIPFMPFGSRSTLPKIHMKTSAIRLTCFLATLRARRHCLAAILICAAGFDSQLATVHAQGTAFTYQGRLNDGAIPASGTYDLTFALFSGSSGAGGQVGGTLTHSPVNVSNGLFTVTLDFGPSVFTGPARWLEIAVKSNGVAAAHTALTPRQALTASPYAIFAGGAQSAAAVAAGGVNAAALASGAVGSGAIADGSIAPGDLSPSLLNGTFWRLNGNTGPGNFLGSTDNRPLELRVNNVPGFRLQPNGAEVPSVMGGSESNAILPGAIGAVIAGGGNSVGGLENVITGPGRYGTIGGGAANRVEGQEGTVAGGNINQAGGLGSFVGGGRSNLASGFFSTVTGGSTNQALGAHNTIAGGSHNLTRLNFDTVGGGSRNEATGGFSAVPGGLYNKSAGYISTVGGGQFNEATGQSSVIAGGANNRTADYASVGGGRLNLASGTNSAIAGGMDNRASAFFSSIGGGTNNQVASEYGTIGGGQANTIAGPFTRNGTIAGGHTNYIGGDSVAATIGGGAANLVKNGGQWAVIAGGAANTNEAGSTRGVISGGQENLVTGPYGTIPGGFYNEATHSAFAAGSAAKARHHGSWVWADHAAGFDVLGNFSGAPFASTGTNQFLLRASGGVGINTNHPQATLHVRGNIAADALRAPGAGVNTRTFAFVHRAVTTNTSGNTTYLNNPLTDSDPGALVILTHNWSADTNSVTKYNTTPVGVYYSGGRWAIFNEDSSPMGLGRAFNVMVIKP